MTSARLPVDEPLLRRTIRDAHGIDLVDVAIEPGGADAAAVGLRGSASDGGSWFIKLRAMVRPAGILVPRFLHDHGLAEVVASIPPRSGEPWLQLGDWSVHVYPLVAAPPVMTAGMGLDGWRRLGAFAARLHAVALPGDLAALLDREAFRPPNAALARDVDRYLRSVPERDLDSLSAAVRRRWLAERGTILLLVERAETLGARIRDRDGGSGTSSPAAFVVCHADLHAANVLVGADGSIRIVDWDELLFAPPERDLMFVRDSVVAGPVSDAQAGAFEQGYGRDDADPLLIAYYRLDWAVQDLSGYAHEVLLQPGREPADRARAAERFHGQFGAGGEVPWALAADAALSARRTGRPDRSSQTKMP